MILGRHCQPLLIFLERWSFGYGPGLQNIMHLQPETVMQMSGCVLLNHKPAPTTLPTTLRCSGFSFRRLSEVSFSFVWLESFTPYRFLRALLLEITSQLRRKFLHLFQH